MDIVEQLIAYRDRPGRSSAGRKLIDDACNEIGFLRREIERLGLRLRIEEARDGLDVIGQMLEPGAIVPVDIKTTSLLVQEIRRLRDLR